MLAGKSSAHLSRLREDPVLSEDEDAESEDAWSDEGTFFSSSDSGSTHADSDDDDEHPFGESLLPRTGGRPSKKEVLYGISDSVTRFLNLTNG